MDKRSSRSIRSREERSGEIDGGAARNGLPAFDQASRETGTRSIVDLIGVPLVPDEYGRLDGMCRELVVPVSRDRDSSRVAGAGSSPRTESGQNAQR